MLTSSKTTLQTQLEMIFNQMSSTLWPSQLNTKLATTEFKVPYLYIIHYSVDFSFFLWHIPPAGDQKFFSQETEQKYLGIRATRHSGNLEWGAKVKIMIKCRLQLEWWCLSRFPQLWFYKQISSHKCFHTEGHSSLKKSEWLQIKYFHKLADQDPLIEKITCHLVTQ